MAHTFYSPQPQPHAHLWAVADLTSLGIIGATFLGWLPHIAAGLSVIYLSLQILISWRNWRQGKNNTE